jgi:hypothetical protein
MYMYYKYRDCKTVFDGTDSNIWISNEAGRETVTKYIGTTVFAQN